MNEIGLLELSNNALNMTPLFHQKLKLLHEKETSISNRVTSLEQLSIAEFSVYENGLKNVAFITSKSENQAAKK